MIVLIPKLITIVVLAVIWTRLKRLADQEVRARLGVSAILFAASIVYEMVTPWVVQMFADSIIKGDIRNITLWVQVIPLPGYLLVILALLNLIPVLRNK